MTFLERAKIRRNVGYFVCNPILLKNFIKALTVVSEKPTLLFMPHGFQSYVKSDNKTISLDFECLDTSFKEYYCPKPLAITFTDMQPIKKTLALTEKNETIAVSFKRGELVFRIWSKEYRNDGSLRIVEVNSLKISELFQDVPKILPKTRLLLKARDLKVEVRKLHNISFFPYMILSADSESASITVGNVSGKATNTLPKERIETTEPSKALYGFRDFRKAVLAGSRLAKFVTLEYSTNSLLRICFRPEKFQGRLDYYLTPFRITA